jgi:hypothetical protein
MTHLMSDKVAVLESYEEHIYCHLNQLMDDCHLGYNTKLNNNNNNNNKH